MSDSEIIVGAGGTMFAGPDAVSLYRAAVLRSSLKLLSVGIRPTRGVTMTKALALCGEYTGQRYKRGEWQRATQDLTVWIETMKSALPIVQR